jgi:hypothetical protein
MANSIEDANADELARDRARDKKKPKPKAKPKKAGALKTVLKNPIFKLLIPFGVEVTPLGGMLPSWTFYVIYTYFEEKKAGLSPNIAVFLIVGGAAVAVDAIDLIEPTGFGMIIAKGIDIPTMGFLLAWRMLGKTKK